MDPFLITIQENIDLDDILYGETGIVSDLRSVGSKLNGIAHTASTTILVVRPFHGNRVFELQVKLEQKCGAKVSVSSITKFGPSECSY